MRVWPYQEVDLDLHVMIYVMYANLSVQLNCAPSQEMDTVIIILRISAYKFELI